MMIKMMTLTIMMIRMMVMMRMKDDIESMLQVDQVEKSELVTCRRGRRGLGLGGRRTQIEISEKGTVMLLVMMMVMVMMLMMMKRIRGNTSGL